MIQNDELSLAKLIVTFVNADSWEESQSLVEQYPELLTDEVDDLLKSSLSSPTHFQRSIYLHALGLSLRDYYKQTDDYGDLQRSIETLNQAIHSLIPTSSYRGAYLNSLAVSLSDNYAYTDSVEDFNAAK